MYSHEQEIDLPGRELTPYLAVGICEGFEESQGEDEVIRAWQYLIDTGECWKLQGFFGRTASNLIERGICHAQAQE